MVTGTEDLAHAVEAAAVMNLLPNRPRLLALGEPTHGDGTLLDVRNALFRQLVEDEGYRTIALESDCLAGLLVDDHITTGRGSLDDVLARGLSHGWGAWEGNRALVRWMRAHNARAEREGRPASERLRFAGIDGPLEITHAASPRAALTELHRWLAAGVAPHLLPSTEETLDRLLGADERWTEPAAMRDPARSFGRSAEARELRLYADELVALLDERTPELIAASSAEEWERARLYGRTAVGLLRYHHWMADRSPARMTRLVGLRDQLMAQNLLALARRGPTLVGSHNGHLQRSRSTMRMDDGQVAWWSAGALAGARLGEDYAFLATAIGTLRDRGVEAPPRNTVEGLLHALPGDRSLVDARRLVAALADRPPAARVSPWFGYAPLDPAHLSELDGIVYVRDVREAGLG
ncbi:erythromycin esterase [Streptomyces sp. 3MP-14]|uniref:Erythromycin esterase n=1 Tax=Streptomyces mimosae TaxID=2586635 RepID=A0A5N6AJH8_9ACTN|nr:MULTISPECIES: erythromycin esterase family protein [Streptomyces]KAB8168881.1 erythromycin esterase [Streptomyces mimosae]KAB8177840.1 erythromycin esterase [Streptomyces sp. 3MP-14]